MEQNRLVLNDGTTIKDGFASKTSRDQLMLRIPGNDLVQAAVIFSNHDKTEQIVCYYAVHKTTYTGFTSMLSVQYFADENYVEIWLEPAEGIKPTMKQELTVPAIYMNSEKGENSDAGEHVDVGED